jgi:hypothetical protein
LEEALADAEEYKYLLLRAIRRTATETEATTISPETVVLPFYAAAA